MGEHQLGAGTPMFSAHTYKCMGGALYHFTIIASLVPRPRTTFAQQSVVWERDYIFILFMGKMMYSGQTYYCLVGSQSLLQTTPMFPGPKITGTDHAQLAVSA